MFYIANLFSVFFIFTVNSCTIPPIFSASRKIKFHSYNSSFLANVVKSRSFEKYLLFCFPTALMLVQILISKPPQPGQRMRNSPFSSFDFWPYCNPNDFAKHIANANFLRPVLMSIKLIVRRVIPQFNEAKRQWGVWGLIQAICKFNLNLIVLFVQVRVGI